MQRLRLLGYRVALIALFLLLAAGSSCTTEEETSEAPVMTPTPEAVETPLATPTPTPTPPPAPTPTPTPELGPSEEEEYGLEMEWLLVDVGDITWEVSGYMVEVAEDPSWFLDPFLREWWLEGLTIEREELQAIQTAVLLLEPPPTFAEAHDLIIRSLDELAVALDLLDSAARNADVDQMYAVADRMEEATRLMELALEVMPPYYPHPPEWEVMRLMELALEAIPPYYPPAPEW